MLNPQPIGRFDTWPVEFGRDGNILHEAQVQALLSGCASATDLLVLSHGWNNDEAEASELYEELLGNLSALPAAGGAARRMVVMRVYWPSKRFADDELIPGGAASAGNAGNAALEIVQTQIDALLHEYELHPAQPAEAFKPQALRAMRALLPQLEDDVDAQADFARCARLLMPASVNEEEEVLLSEFQAAEGSELLHKLSRPFRPPLPTDQGGATGAVGSPDGEAEQGGAAGLGNMLRGAFNGARNLLNLFTYYEMKERAGVVGRTGVSDVMRRALIARPGLRLHLCGHSFGGRLVASALASRDAQPDASAGVRSLVLLQSAFSHNGFGILFDGHHNGFFRSALEANRLNGPVVVTHTERDRAVGLAYPIASRLRNQVASGLGDADDPYGAIGRNGALFAPAEIDRSETALRDVDQSYSPFHPGRIYNLHGGIFITGHSAVRGPQVAQALRHALDASL
jgi:hypothetical protein